MVTFLERVAEALSPRAAAELERLAAQSGEGRRGRDVEAWDLAYLRARAAPQDAAISFDVCCRRRRGSSAHAQFRLGGRLLYHQ